MTAPDVQRGPTTAELESNINRMAEEIRRRAAEQGWKCTIVQIPSALEEEAYERAHPSMARD